MMNNYFYTFLHIMIYLTGSNMLHDVCMDLRSNAHEVVSAGTIAVEIHFAAQH